MLPLPPPDSEHPETGSGVLRRYSDDHRLWFLIFLAFFVPIWSFFAAVCIGENMWRPGGIAWDNFKTVFSLMAEGTIVIGFGSALLGWLIHAVMVMSGWRSRESNLDQERKDYTDSLPTDSRMDLPARGESSHHE